jgi:transposase-like protein
LDLDPNINHKEEKTMTKIYTHEDRINMLKAVKEFGGTTKEACLSVGISLPSYYLWTKKYSKRSKFPHRRRLKAMTHLDVDPTIASVTSTMGMAQNLKMVPLTPRILRLLRAGLEAEGWKAEELRAITDAVYDHEFQTAGLNTTEYGNHQ